MYNGDINIFGDKDCYSFAKVLWFAWYLFFFWSPIVYFSDTCKSIWIVYTSIVYILKNIV